MPLLTGRGDRYVRWAMAGAVIVATCMTGYLVGKVDGRLEARRQAWRECNQRIEAASARVALVRLADPCEGAK